MRTFGFLATTAIGLWMAPASAQTGTGTAAPPPPDVAIPVRGAAGTSTQAAGQDIAGSDQRGAAQEDAGALADIVVTAQRRSENLQQVPIVVTTATGVQLQNLGVQDTLRLNTVSPGVNIRTTVGSFQPFIRGIGTSSSIVENPVALYVDGVYLPQQREGIRELNDIDQVAILKGPQGTLFGRNATGGVIQISTRGPSQDFQADAKIRYANYNTIHGDAFVAGGLSDTLSASLSAEYTHQGNGWGKNYSTGHDTYKLDHEYGLRGKLLFQPSDATRILLSVDYIDRSQLGLTFVPYKGTVFGYEGLTRPDGSLITLPPLKNDYDTYAQNDGRIAFHGGGASLTIDQQLGFAKLVSITSYRQGNGTNSFDNSAVSPSLQFSSSTDQPDTSYTQEFQLVSDAKGKLSWATGVYLFHYLNATNGFYRFRGKPLLNPSSTFVQGREVSKSIAPFAQADWEFLPATKLTLGARYTVEKRTLTGTNNPRYDLANPVIGAAVPEQENNVNQPTFRAALNHEFTATVSGYASFNTGFKSGGFNIYSPTSPGYLPEKLKSYEVGAKSELLDRHVRLNIAGFYYDYTNIQVNQQTIMGQIIANGAKAQLYGADLDFEARLSSKLRLSGGIEVLHTEFTDYQNALKNIAFPAKGATVGVGDVTGSRLPLAQKFSGTLAIDYDADVAAGKLHFNVTTNYNGQYYFEPDNFLQQKAYVLLNSSIRYTLPNSRYNVMVFANNLLDTRVISQTSSQNFQGYPTVYGSAPRTYGVTLEAKF